MSSYYGNVSTRAWSADAESQNQYWGWKWASSGSSWTNGSSQQETCTSSVRWDAGSGNGNGNASGNGKGFPGESEGWGQRGGGWSGSGAQSWYRPSSSARDARWEGSRGAAPPRPSPAQQVPEVQEERCPQPDDASVQAALTALEDARKLWRADGKSMDSSLFSQAIQLCSASGDSVKALDLLDEMKDEFELDPDEATYLAAIDACAHGAGYPLQRVWVVIDEMLRQGLDPSMAENTQMQVHGNRQGLRVTFCNLQRHAESWLSSQLPPAVAPLALRLAGLLFSRQLLGKALEISLRQALLVPLLRSLGEAPPMAPTTTAATAVSASTSLSASLAAAAGGGFSFSLGSLTASSMAELGLGCLPEAWRQRALRELRRQRLLRCWADWQEARPGRPGLLAWLAYDLSPSSASGSAGTGTWSLSSSGEVFGAQQQRQQRHPNGETPQASSSQPGSTEWPPLVPADGRGHLEGEQHAERRALLVLLGRICRELSASGGEACRLEGLVMLYSLRPPSLASLCAMKQFLHLFPWVRLCVGYGEDSEREQRPVRTIGAPRPPATPGKAWDWGTWGDSNGANNGWGSQSRSTARNSTTPEEGGTGMWRQWART